MKESNPKSLNELKIMLKFMALTPLNVKIVSDQSKFANH